ncbi:HNH endonuclease family protein [Corynebacterium guangdongense]|uniref:GmrSD restriction endonucleases C-terminal domain-containing protein n=1 Tax=Corynebacterium guangdongense TaxID=1783348 RepID=A0ABU1ZXS1_9CORY|nr:HNH endonuclease family protein [Corynebacterium guangdongense]MDR7329173.1 hypothetical protein [Corynebacterium guangdongense]WJZ17740.1 hypothetical protein CGUA_05790 [Corynebacterium guangdongense]
MTIVLSLLLALLSGLGLLNQADLPSLQPLETTQTAPGSSGHPGAGEQAPAAAARQQLAELPIKGRAPLTGYDRDAFGPAWTDDVAVTGGHNGCDTRNDILRRDLVDTVIREGTHGCLVESGVLHDPFSAQTIDFNRGDGQVDIDHVVALANAWVTGAQFWDDATRRDFANDPVNLLAVDSGLNRQKGAGDAATWLPPNTSFRCDYVSTQIRVKHTYGLWVTQAEADAMSRELDRCPA